MALQRLMEVVQKGDEMYHGMVLDILKAIFEVNPMLATFPCRASSKQAVHSHPFNPFSNRIRL